MEINKTILKKSGFLKIEMKRGKGEGEVNALGQERVLTSGTDNNPFEKENVTKTLVTEVSNIVSSIHEIKEELNKIKVLGFVYNVNINHGKQGMNSVNETVPGR